MRYELPQTVDGEQPITLYEATATEPAVVLLVTPIGPSDILAAQEAFSEVGHPIESIAGDRKFDAYSRIIAKRCMVGWEGIGKDGVPAPFNEQTVDALLTDSDVLGLLQGKIILPYLKRQAEKNVLALSSAGTSPATTGAKDTAPAAPSAAPSARTPSKPRRVAKAKPSGK